MTGIRMPVPAQIPGPIRLFLFSVALAISRGPIEVVNKGA